MLFSKILTKLIDRAIVPAVLVFSARIVTVVLVSRYFNIPFTIDNSGFVFQKSADYVVVNSYSIFFMTISLAVGMLYVLLKSYIFHEDTISPAMTAKLFSIKMPALIQNSYEIYTQGVIWLSYMFLLSIVTGVLMLFNMIYAWVLNVSVVITLVSTLFTVLDIESKIKVIKTKGVTFDDNSEYLANGREILE